jgi:ABC-type phosphate transport system auxiliary subunit
MTTLTDRYQIEIVGDLSAMSSADQIVKTAQAVKRLERSLKDVEASVAGLNKINRALSRLLATTDGAAERISATTRALQRLARVTASTDATMGKAAAKIRTASTAASRLESASQGAADSLDNVQDEARAAGRALDRAGDSGRGFGDTLGSIGRTAAGVAAGLLAYESIMGGIRAAFDLARAGVQAYAETSEEGARAQATLQASTQSLTAAVGAGVVQSEAFTAVQEVLARQVAESSRLTAAFTGTLNGLAILTDNVITALFGLDGQVTATGEAMDRSDRAAQAITTSIRALAIMALDSTIAIQALIDAVGLLPAVANIANETLFGAGGASAVAEFNRQLEAGRARIRELRDARVELDAALRAPATQTPGTQSTVEAPGAEAPAASTPRGAGRAAPPELFDFSADTELDAYIRSVAEASEKANRIIKEDAERRAVAIRRDAELREEGNKRILADSLAAQQAAIDAQREAQQRAREQELEAAREHAERLNRVLREVAGQTAEVSANLITAGFTSAFDGEAEKFGKAAKKIIGQQLVALGQSAIAASAIAFIGDPAAGFLPNPARGALLLGAGTAAVGVGVGLGASGGSSGASPAREAPQTVTQNQNVTNYNLSFAGYGDRRTQSRAIADALGVRQ